MHQTRRALAPLLAIPFLFGCISSPEVIDLEAPPPGDPITDASGMARIVVYRHGEAAWTDEFDVSVNDEPLGGIFIKDYVQAQVAPGMVTVVATAGVDSEARFPVEADHAYYLRALPIAGWVGSRPQLVLVSSEEGRSAVADCADKTGVMDD